jgi:hypothetical protein
MTLEGVDFSFGRPGGAALVAAGKQFVVRYIRPGDGRTLTAAEVKDYRAHGLAICLVFESSPGRAKEGAAAGKADAAVAAAGAKALGFPTDRPIYFAVDFNATSKQFPMIDAYLVGAASAIGLGRVGVYGHSRLMAHCAKAGTASWFWQTRGWSKGVEYPGHLFQYHNGQAINGGAVDFTRSLKADFGQWDVTTNTGTTTEGAVHSFPVPKVPTIGDVAKGVVLYTSDALDPTDPKRIIVDPGRSMPYLGDPRPGVRMVAYIDEHGVHSGKAYFVKAASLTTIRPGTLP